MASYNSSSLLILLSILLPLVHSYNNGGVTLDLIHRDSSSRSTKSRFERLRDAFDFSFTRKASLASRLAKKLDDSIDAPLQSNGGSYLIRYKIGTPPVEQLSIADTGSDLTWIQCQPCSSCYKQDYPLFDPSKTRSYRPLSCDASLCSESGSSGCGSNNACQYQVSYGDRSYSYGELAAETLTLGANASFPKVVFGCGNNNDGTFSETGSGIVGLGGGDLSIVKQLDRTIGGKFSYCLTYLDSNFSSKISFGSDAIVAGANVLSTPLVSKSPATFYYLTLEAVSVGTEKVIHKPAVSTEQISSDEGNIIIDSGTTLTFVPSELYDGVERALESAVQGTRVTDPQGTFGLCYEGSGGLTAPPVTAHLKGADVVLPERSIFLEVEKGVVCLTLVPSQDLAIFGNLHQADYQVGYDLVKQQVNFLPTDCTKPR